MDCAVCLERFDNDTHKPMVLQCGHTFCISCIHRIYKFRKPECPIDRAKITQPLSQVRVNYTVQDIISSFSTFSISNSYPVSPEKSPLMQNPTISYAQELMPSAPESINSLYNENQIIHQTIKCPKDHNLYEITTNSSQPTTNYIKNIICNFCRMGKLTKSWSCSICSFDLCLICMDDQMSCEPLQSDCQILCENSHALYYYKNSDLFYSRKLGTQSRVCCNFCQKNWNGGSWACRICQFDLCNECVDKSQLAVNLQCNNKHFLHVLKKESTNEGAFVCTVCKIISHGQGFCCKPCKFIMCQTCSEYFIRSIYLPFTCYNGHGLVNSDEQVALYFLRTSNRTFICNGCKKVCNNPKNFHCRRCEFDLCYECYNTLVQGVNKGISRKCRNNHELLWFFDTCSYYRNGFRCDLCRMQYGKCGSFHCRLCKFDVCLVCSASIINR